MAVIYIDTRQKKDKHLKKHEYFKSLDYELIEDKKLEVGDYMLCLDCKISVDTKCSIYELASNLFSNKDKTRFQRELKLAKKLGIKLYILTEQQFSKERLLAWKDKKGLTKVSGKQIYDRMQIYSLAFGVKWRFCRKCDSGKMILKLLGVGK